MGWMTASRTNFFPKIGEVLRPYFGEGEKLEMAKADLKLLEAAEKVTKPFYKK